MSSDLFSPPPQGAASVPITPSSSAKSPPSAKTPPSAKAALKAAPDPGEEGKPPPYPGRWVKFPPKHPKDYKGDPIQAPINTFDEQGVYYHSEDPGITAENVMQYIIRESLQETKYRGPICSALENGVYNQPHQVILMQPASLHTNRSHTGKYIQDSVP